MENKLGHVLIVGAGPSAFQTAAILREHCSCLGLVSRRSVHWQARKDRLLNGETVNVQVAKPSLTELESCFSFDRVFDDINQIEGKWDTLIFATPACALVTVLQALPEQTIMGAREVVLLSSWFGGHCIAKGFFVQQGLTPNIVVFSNYYAATKFCQGGESLSVVTKAVKKKIYTYVSKHENGFLSLFKLALNKCGVEILALDNGFSVEGRNITLYVHSAFFIQPFSLNHIFGDDGEKKFMYKLFPEGPITPASIETLVSLWHDVSLLINEFEGEAFNLLKFLNDDNYPVRQESLSREQIDSFCECSKIEQEYRLYVRYSAILIDPFSSPDLQGRYFDFSAVPFIKGDLDKGDWPRIPSEDIQALYWLSALASYHKIHLPTVEKILNNFESWLADRQHPNRFLQSSHNQSTQSLKWLYPKLGVTNE